MRRIWILVFILCCAIEIESKNCCPGENILDQRFCKGTKEKVDLNCTKRFLLSPKEDDLEKYEIDSKGRLVYDDFPIEPEMYCITHFPDNSEVAVVCLDVYGELDDNEKWYGLRAACSIASVVFLIITLSVYIIVPGLRDLQGKCIMHSLTFLAISLSGLSFLQLFAISNCYALGYICYFGFLTTFFWLNVTSFQIWKTTVFPNMLGTDQQWHVMYILYAYGMSSLFLIILITAQHVEGDHLKPGLGNTSCWLTGTKAIWAYFYGPITILLCVNLIFFVWSILTLSKINKSVTDTKLKSLKYKVGLYVKLFFIMGLTWFFEVTSAALDKVHYLLDYVWIITDYLNALQGLFILLLLVVFRKRALRGLASKRICGWQFPNTWKLFEDEECICEEEEGGISNGQL